MKKASIVGAFEFIGFHLGKKILDSGIEVDGIHLDIKEKELWAEEKRMEVGRNLNFKEKNVGEWNPGKNETIFVDFYDFFMREREELFFNQDLQHRLQNTNDKILLILPISLLAGKRFESLLYRVNEWIESNKPKDGNIQQIFLPTVFGPWQPEEFSFQQILLKKDWNNNEREWTFDLLYVENAVMSILHAFNIQEEKILLKSGQKDKWGRSLKLLDQSFKEMNKKPELQFQGIEIVVDEVVPLEEGLKKQIQYNKLAEQFGFLK